MERIKSLTCYEKVVFFLTLAVAAFFSILYPITMAKTGFLYIDTIFIPTEAENATIYSGKLRGVQSRFVVYRDNTAEFYYGEKYYGPYTLKEDVPIAGTSGKGPTGLELCLGDTVLFRGTVGKDQNSVWLFYEDGRIETGSRIYATTENRSAVTLDETGNIIDPIKPTAAEILDLLTGPMLRHKGNWQAWAVGVLLCVCNAVSILYADALFQWRLAFQIESVDRVEPSEWELIRRRIGWNAVLLVSLVLFIMGLSESV